MELDVTSDESVKTAVASIAEDAGGTIDVLVNNAGIFIGGLSESLSSRQLDQLFQINVIGADRVVRAVLPFMRAQKSGLLITISSGLARLHLPTLGGYSAAKAAVDTMAETYHYELSPLGIESIVVQPGAFPTTDIASNQMTPENAAVEAAYGALATKLKQGIGHLFAPTPENSNADVVADLIGEIIATPAGKRLLWYPIGLGGGKVVSIRSMRPRVN